MKKWFSVFLAAIMTLMMFSACASDSPSLSPSSTDDSALDIESGLESETDSEKSNEPESEEETAQNEFPDSIKNVHDKIVAVSEKDYPDLEIGELGADSVGNLAFTVEDTSDESQTDTERTLNISFGSVEYNPEDSSFSIVFDMKKQNKTLKKWIALWMQACDKTLSYEDAQSKMQDFVNTYSSDAFSDVVECGDYLLLLSPGDNYSFAQSLTAAYKPCLWNSIDESEYAPADYSTYKASDVNSGTKVVLKGIVKELTIDEPKNVAPFARLAVQDDSGNEYIAVYDYVYTPITFSVGGQLTIYGDIGNSDGKSVIFVDKIIN